MPDKELPAEGRGTPSQWENLKHWTDKIVSPKYQLQNPAEEILGKFGANLFRGIEAVGGRIIITNRRLLFESHRVNLQRKPVAIPLDEIAGVEMCRTFRIVPNGMKVRCQSGQLYQFVLWDRKKVIDLIRQQRPTIRF